MSEQWPFDSKATADQVLSGKDLAGRVIIVTGANSGIGFETARALAAAGASVILACRDMVQGNEAFHRIEAAQPGSNLQLEGLDLASLESVREFCTRLAGEHVDTLICNAGTYATEYAETADGFELTVGVGHLGHFLLTRELLPQILASDSPRVVMVSSESHRMPARLDFESLPYRKDNYAAMKAYGQAKLCNALMAAELDRRYRDQGLTACSLHPGTLVSTGMASHSTLLSLLMRVARPFTKSPVQAAATPVFCATWNKPENLAGKYFSDCRPKEPSEEASDARVAARLWDISEQWLSAKSA